MADVTGNEDFICSFTGYKILSVGKVPLFKRRIYTDFVLLLGQAYVLMMAKAKPPVLVVIRSAVRD
jgi:hypothetical protein